MDENRITAVLHWHSRQASVDIDVPLDISANELIIALNEAFKMEMNTADLSKCHLKAENPIALLRGNKLLRDYGLRNGTIIHYTQ